MTKSSDKARRAPLPTKDQLLSFIRESPGRVGKRELARAFHVTGSDRVTLKRMLKELQQEGQIERGARRRFGKPGQLPDVGVLEVSGTDTDGELLARPLAWNEDEAPPRIYLAPDRSLGVMGIGDRALCRLRRISDREYEARIIRRLAAAPGRVLGIFEAMPDGGGRIRPVNRREKAEYLIGRGDAADAREGELVLADILPGRRLGLRQAKIAERLGRMDSPNAVSLIAIHAHGIPTSFPEDALAQAEAAAPAPMEEREDLREVPLVTIDGADARDFDDAVWAAPDADATNPGGWRVMVAIADVAWYVRWGDALDKAAHERGNSVYFPDRVVPMLPEALSKGWCSLNPHEDRPCMAVEMIIDATGRKRRHRFLRGMMRSHARLTYEAVQAAVDGMADESTEHLVGPVLKPLFGAFEAFRKDREARGVLDLDLPERRVVIGEDGRVAGIEPRARLDSHKLIEEFMIAANVAAAEELERLGLPCMYRVHDLPSPEKVAALRDFLKTLDLKFAASSRPRPEHFNQILRKTADTPHQYMVNEIVLRSQAQAAYSPDNIGHFGLALARYAHFTSPIRRYADLLVHRALISGLKLGAGGLPPDAGPKFPEIALHVSATERRAAQAEREAVDRFTAAYLADRVGATFTGRINGVTRFGLFITLDETGADGLVPISSLGNDYYHHDESRHCLVGRRQGRVYRLGERVTARLVEANALTASLVFELLETGDGSEPPARTAKKTMKGKGRMTVRGRTKKH